MPIFVSVNFAFANINIQPKISHKLDEGFLYQYSFCNNFATTGSTGLKFWNNVDTYSGNLWCEF